MINTMLEITISVSVESEKELKDSDIDEITAHCDCDISYHDAEKQIVGTEIISREFV